MPYCNGNAKHWFIGDALTCLGVTVRFLPAHPPCSFFADWAVAPDRNKVSSCSNNTECYPSYTPTSNLMKVVVLVCMSTRQSLVHSALWAAFVAISCGGIIIVAEEVSVYSTFADYCRFPRGQLEWIAEPCIRRGTTHTPQQIVLKYRCFHFSTTTRNFLL
jgi:hypothetical protein